MQRGRAPFAVPVLAVHSAEIFLPTQLAIEIQTIKPLRAEERKEMLAIGDRRGGSQAASVVSPLVRQCGFQRLLPDDAPAFPIHGENDELMALSHRQVVMRARSTAVSRLELFANRDGTGEKHSVTPNNRRGVPQTWQVRFPAHISRLAPLDRGIRSWGDARTTGTAPLRPFVFSVWGVTAGRGSLLADFGSHHGQGSRQRRQAKNHWMHKIHRTCQFANT